MLEKCLQLKITTLLIFFLRFGKFLKKLVNNKLVDHVETSGLFSDFQYDFRSYRSTADCQTVVSDARAFNRSGATQAVARDISKAFDRVWHVGLLHKLLNLREFRIRYLALFCLFSVRDSFRWF